MTQTEWTHFSIRCRYSRCSVVFFVVLFSLSLGSATLRAQHAPLQASYKAYIETYSEECIRQMHKHKIPASITMAQALIESGAGKSRLATEGKNHFGIKCHKAWQGERIYANDDLPNECFRKYLSVKDSYNDHSIFLKQARYKRLFTYPITDYKSWARGLQQCGYATNKGYANMLIRIIEQYELYHLDRGKKPSWMKGGQRWSAPAKRPEQSNKTPTLTHEGFTSYGLVYVLANAHDSFASIAEELGMNAEKLAKYNDAPVDFPLKQGDVVYIEKKNKKATADYPTHTVVVGDSMHSIAQRYGIRVSSLYYLNQLDDEYVPMEGDILKLR